jgi:hypothetical protein
MRVGFTSRSRWMTTRARTSARCDSPDTVSSFGRRRSKPSLRLRG